MKKYLLSVMALAAIGFAQRSHAQTCNLQATFIEFNPGVAPAPWAIDGSVADWETILGTGTGNAITPYNPPASSAANWSQDGTEAIGPDLDTPTPPRDLRFFSFTYDQYNVYFYFRRINNSNSQNTFLYILDVNADGYMNDGEPVLRANFSSSSVSAFAIHPYVTNTGVDFVSGKGNYMTHPTTGIADGYSVTGSFGAAASLPALAANEVFQAAVTENGFGVEFAVPWRYLKNYLTNTAPLVAGDVFTYHISTQNGTGSQVTNDATDNAGGCCSGLATIGSPNYTVDDMSIVSTVIPNREYLLSVRIKNNSNAPAKVALDNVVFGNIIQHLGRPIASGDFAVKGYIDGNGNGVIDGTDAASLKTFTHSSGVFPGAIIFGSPLPKDTVAVAPLGGFAYFLVNVSFPSNFSVKQSDIQVLTSGVLDLPLGPCQQAGVPNNAPGLEIVQTLLPVDFKTFSATRNRSNVMLKWETTAEFNNSGFAIERNISGSWEQVGFVASQAQGGNSNSLLSYSSVDVNNAKGISQYRIKQIDFDGTSKYTEIRTVRGENQMGQIIVYPNPSIDGSVNISFESAIARDITVSDMSGRIVKQMKGVNSNNIKIDNLTPGMYNLRVVDPATGAQAVEKIVVNKR